MPFTLQCYFFVFTMSVVSESVSHSTLTTVVSRLDLQFDGLGMRSADTPIPRERISDETINVLNQAYSKLEETAKETSRNKGEKRARQDSAGPSTEPYPPEAKPIYLRLKTNQRRKIGIASQINNMHTQLLKGVYPSSVQFKFNINTNRSDKVKKYWETIIRDCKHKLTTVLLDELFERYSNIKDAISTDYDELAKILNESQIMEIKDFLKKRDHGMAPILAQKNKRQYEPPKK